MVDTLLTTQDVSFFESVRLLTLPDRLDPAYSVSSPCQLVALTTGMALMKRRSKAS